MIATYVRTLVRVLVLGAVIQPAGALATEHSTSSDDLLGRSGTVFVAQQALKAPKRGALYIVMGRVETGLESPVGSCRLTFRGSGREVPAGAKLAVASVSRTRSPHADRGISSVTIRFRAGDPAESLFCDTVGNAGPTLGEIMSETQGVFAVESPYLNR